MEAGGILCMPVLAIIVRRIGNAQSSVIKAI